VKFRFLVPASIELDDAAAFYDAQRPGLGYQFAMAVQASLSRIERFPESYQRIGRYSRRCLVAGFPYGIIYQLRPAESHVLVIAVAHLHRHPDYWQRRES